jgi:hypothetical protein
MSQLSKIFSDHLPMASKAIRWYLNGNLLPLGNPLSSHIDGFVTNVMKENKLDMSPTTYEEAKAYLEELKKPEGSRDLLREMCFILPIKVPENEDAVLVLPRAKVIVPIGTGKHIVNLCRKYTT